MEVFGKKYAEYYDLIYREKDYVTETEVIVRILKTFKARGRDILELGCGTGGHALLLAQRGYRVTGLDRSPYMLERARQKAGSLPIEFRWCDIHKLPDLGKRFDACISMFHVLNYLSSRKELAQVIGRARSSLVRGGLMIFDSWNGLAVLKDRPKARSREIRRKGFHLVRKVRPELDVFTNVCDNKYQFMIVRDGKVREKWEENHRIRYLFPVEVTDLLREHDFETIQLTSNDGQPLKEDSWSMLAVARAI